MSPNIQDTLLELFEQVRQDSDTIPTMPVNDWQDGSVEWQLLTSFNSMLEQLQQRTLQLMRTEQQLREKEEQYRCIFDATLDGLTISDLRTGIIIETNPANYRMFGYTYEEMIGLSPSDVVPPDYLPVVGEGLQTIKAGGRNDLVMVAQRKDGTRFPIEVHSTLFTYKGKPHLLSVSRDITERVEAEQQLREREEQYRTIFEASTDAVMIGDLEDGHIVEANPAACQMYGYSYEEFIGLGPDTITPPDYQHLPGEARQMIKEGGQFQSRGVALHKDGSTFYVEAHGTPFTYKGKPHQLASVRNITEQVQAEQQLREKEEQYRGVFEATNDALNILDSGGIIVEVNPAFCSMYGYTHDEIVGLHASRLTLPEYFPVLAESLDTVYAGGRYQTQGLALRKDGTTFHAEAHSATFIYQGKPHLLGVSRDITERVEAEQQLREKERQYRAIFEATSDGLIISDLDGVVVEANPAACKIYGYAYEELLGLSPSALTHPDSLSEVIEDIQMIQGEGQIQARRIGLRKDGTSFYAEAHGTPFMYKSKPHVLAIIRDVTEQVQAEQQLREREEQYRSIFEATYDGLVINDLDGFCVEANPTYCRLLGYTYEEIIGLPYSKTTFPEYYPILDENSRTIRAGVQFQTQGLARRKDGSALPVEALSTPFTYKGKPHMLGVMRDITERVQAEKQLREKEEQYRSIFEATTDGLIISNLRGLIIEANPAACRMYGYAYEEFVGLHGTDITSPDAHFLLTEALQTIRTDGRSLSPIRATGVRKDGTTFPTEGYGTPIMYKGKPHILAVVRDITEQVRAEEQLREKEEQYRSIFEATSDGLIIRNMDGFVVESNPAAYTMHGYTYQEFLGLHRTDIIAPEDHSMVTEYMKAIQTGRTFRGQAVDLRKDGTAFPVEVRGSLFTYLGKPHTLSVLRDITEHVQAEQQLREKEEQYRSIFEATNDGLDILDPDGFIVEANPAFCSMFGYTREELIGLEAGKLTAPQSRHLVEESRESIKEGRDIQVEGLALRKDGSIFHAEAHLTALIYQGRPHMLGVTRDITERVRAEQELREKEEQYRSIFEATNDALFIMDLEDGHIIEANPAACNIYGYSYEEFIGLLPSAFIHPDKLPGLVEISLPLIRAGGKRHIQGVNLRKDGSAFPIDLHQTAFTYQGKPHILSVMRDTTEQVQAQQLLEQRVEERTRELSTLLEVSHNVASTLELEPLLGLILDQLKTVADYTGSSLLTLESGDFVIVDNRGSYPTEQVARLRFPIRQMKLIWEVISRGEPLIVDDVWADTPLALDYRQVVGDLLETTFPYIHAWMIIPLMLKEKMIGVFTLSSREPGYFTQRHATLALAIANQAAIAIENARLYEQAQELAAVEERQRLARELHDSVSQALYGISLGVHTARLQLDHNPGELAESLDYVLELAEAALTEMRALIFELRPESLEAEGLITALTKQAAAMHARHNIVVQLDLCDEPDVSLKVKRELYRVAQEALHNTVKHAEAGRVDLRLRMADGVVILEVRDDGKGFEATGSFPGHLGLHSMRERVRSLGGELLIESTPGDGTCIRAQVPV